MSGYYETVIRIKEDAIPIDNITKFAWDTDDYASIQEWHEYTQEELKEQKQIEISELKQKLAETDYISNKIVEGDATIEEYADLIYQRKLWRREINDLQLLLNEEE